MSLKLRWCDMGYISLDFRPAITKAELAKLRKLASDMEVGQHLSITLEREDAHQADEILNILRENNYNCQTKGGHSDDDFFIKAKKED